MFMWSLMGLIGKDCPKQICQYFHTLRVCKRDAVILKKLHTFFISVPGECMLFLNSYNTHPRARMSKDYPQPFTTDAVRKDHAALLLFSSPSSLQQDSKCYLSRSEYINMFWNPLGPFRRRNMSRGRIWGSYLRNTDLQKNLIEMRFHE